MTKPREKTREELTAEMEDGKKKIRQLENREKVLRQKLSQEKRRTQRRRLVVRGACEAARRQIQDPQSLPCGPDAALSSVSEQTGAIRAGMKAAKQPKQTRAKRQEQAR